MAIIEAFYFLNAHQCKQVVWPMLLESDFQEYLETLAEQADISMTYSRNGSADWLTVPIR